MRRMRTSLLASAALLLASPAEAETITETVRTALANNPELTVVKSDRRAVDQELRQARAGYFPSIDLRAAVGPEYSDNVTTRRVEGGEEFLIRREAQIGLTQMLFDGFETKSEVERQRARVGSAAFRVEEAAEFIALDAIEAHLEIIRNELIVELNEANIVQHERILGQVRELERSGGGDIADVRQAEARLAQALENLAIARGTLADAIANYQRLTGVRPGPLEDPDAPVAAIPPAAEEAAALASIESPTVLIAAADVDAAAAELRAARANFFPRVDLELGATSAEAVNGSSGTSSSASALVVMTYNLYRGGADIALERESFHRLNEARATLANVRVTAEEEARLSYNALLTARDRTDALRSKAEAQRRVRDAYASQFEIGQRDLLDVLDSENEFFLDRVNLVTAELTETFAIYRVLAVIGALLDTIDVAKPREQISIYRTADDVQTPEAIVEKSIQLNNPDAEARYLRRPEAGAPPAGDRDIAPYAGTDAPVDLEELEPAPRALGDPEAPGELDAIEPEAGPEPGAEPEDVLSDSAGELPRLDADLGADGTNAAPVANEEKGGLFGFFRR